MNYLTNLYTDYPTLINIIKSGIYGLFIFLGIPMDLVSTLGILMGVDTLLGVTKSLKLDEKFSFKILLWGAITKVSILLIPMVIALVAKGLGFDFIWLPVTVIHILIVSEGLSSITNILSIKSGERIENTDYITNLLKAIRKGLSSIIKRLLDKLENGQD